MIDDKVIIKYKFEHMKRLLSFVLVVAMMAISCTKEKESKEEPYNPDGSPITQAQALEIVKEDIEQYDLVYCSKTIINKNTKFATFNERYGVVPCDSWIIMIDSNPLQNGGPKWLYIYVNAYSGSSDADSWEWALPRNGVDYKCVKNKWAEKNITRTSDRLESNINKIQTESFPVESNNWAVIISGGSNPESNYIRYWNDCSIIYKCLRNIHGYRRDHIIVIMSDGKSDAIDRYDNRTETFSSSPQDLDGDGTDDINYSATKSNISKVFSYLGNNVSSDEQVLVYVTDHGDMQDGESFICLWNNTKISASDFANELKKINLSSRKHVVLGQCFSGGFVPPLLSASYNISVATASAGNEYSHAMANGEYDEFLYHWVSAAASRTPDGAVVNADLNGYDGISVEEMFRYTENNDTQDETPQYSSYPESIGEKYGLSGIEFGYPVLSGPYDVSSSSNDNRFELSMLPSVGYSVVWISSSNISVTPIDQTSAMIRNVAPEAMEKGWVQAEVTTPFKTYTLRERVYLWKPGRHVSQNLITGSIQEGTFSLPYCVIGCNEYNWDIGCPDYRNLQDNAYFVDFTYTGDGNPDPYHVSVSFDNPLGESTTIVKYYE